MSTIVVIGTQWGDEGKGKIVDRLAERADLVIRFQGGNNAGHTIVNDYGTYALHLLPAGVFHAGTVNLLGPGTIVNPQALIDEMQEVGEATGISFDTFKIAERAHVVMPYHLALDAAEEQQRGELVQGTTLRGVGPTYADKAARSGVRVGDLLNADYLSTWIPSILEPKNRLLTEAYGLDPLDPSALVDEALAWGEALRPHVVDSLPLVAEALSQNRNIVLEGQLGVMRDLDWGHYPYVTSSSPSAAGACIGAGIPPKALDKVLGIAKAFTSSVGEGPFPTELNDSTGDRLRNVGAGEYGASTGRPRRCGWFDAVPIRTVGALSGVDALALTKIDALDGFEQLRVCEGYMIDGRRVDLAPDTHALSRARPIYRDVPGWLSSTEGVQDYDALPPNAQQYVRTIEEITGIPVAMVGTGQHRTAVATRDPAFSLAG